MEKQNKISNRLLIIIFTAIVIISVGFIIYAKNISYDSRTAEIYVSGELVETIDLNAVTDNYTIELGCGNIVSVEHGAISMAWADCPDQLCVHQGSITNGTYPIVCLPHNVYISIVSSDNGGIDAVVGRGA